MVEVLVYAVGVVLLVGAIATFLFYMYDWYRTATIAPRVDQTALEFATKFEEDLRAGTSITAAASAFNTALGSTTIVSTANSLSTTTTYALVNGRIAWRQNGGSVAYLTPSDMTVTALYLNEITTAESVALRYEIDIAYRTRSGTTTNIYNGLAILRQSYP